jgi:diphthamide synthase (EF-2-diphthine--ammonia ligase)
MAIGDLFLEDIRAYREKQLKDTGLQPIFPVWQIPTRQLALDMIESGLRAKITCVNPKVLAKEFAGRDFDARFLADLPEGIDPCGENGEFHSFVYDGPMFRTPVAVQPGEIVERDGFVFADLLPS